MSTNSLRMLRATNPHNKNCSTRSLLGAAFAVSLCLGGLAEARITKLEITRTESPTFGGASFGTAGQFEKIVGIAYGEVDPTHPLNAIIQDIELAPRNDRGMVEYSTDIHIIKPIDMTKGNRMLFYLVVNRGGGGIPFNIGVVGGNDPTSAGDGFIQNMGYTLVKSGWQADVLPGGGRMTMLVPIAKNPDGSSITGVVRAEMPNTTLGPVPYTHPLSYGGNTQSNHASYATASRNNTTPFPDGFLPTLTVRSRQEDPRIPLPNTEWAFGSCPDGATLTPSDTDICLFSGFQFGKIYELIYRAKDPTVIGLGYAGTRDLVSFFKHERYDDYGTPNPLWTESDATRGHHGEAPLKAVTMGSSQSGRNIRLFIHLGFNEDEAGRTVFEGAYPHIGGGRAGFNIRFGHAGRAWSQQFDNDYPAYESPFSYVPTRDPLTGTTNGILKRCLATNTCPQIFHVATPSEIWEGRQSLGLTDPLGRHDLGEPGFLRTYIMASTQHGSAPFPPPFGTAPVPGLCQQQSNPNPQQETMRALWVAFTRWINEGVAPPPSETPTIRDQTLVLPSKVDFPHIPANNYGGVSRPAMTYTGLVNPLWVLNYGPLFNNEDESGIITVEPPEVLRSLQYTILVTQVDADGNDVAGIRTTALQAPIATYADWNPFKPGLFGEQLCTRQGSYIPFARTRAERLGIGDPRLSLEERYGTHEGYVAAVRAAAQRLVAERYLLSEDAARLIQQAEASDVLK